MPRAGRSAGLRARHRSCQTRGRPSTLDLALPAAPRGSTAPLACSGRSPALGPGRPAERVGRARAPGARSGPRGSAARVGALPPSPEAHGPRPAFSCAPPGGSGGCQSGAVRGLDSPAFPAAERGLCLRAATELAPGQKLEDEPLP